MSDSIKSVNRHRRMRKQKRKIASYTGCDAAKRKLKDYSDYNFTNNSLSDNAIIAFHYLRQSCDSRQIFIHYRTTFVISFVYGAVPISRNFHSAEWFLED